MGGVCGGEEIEEQFQIEPLKPGFHLNPNKTLLKVLLCGDSGVGKTSMMSRYVDGRFSQQYKATIGADFLTKLLEIDGQKYTLQIWDTAGEERFQSLGSTFYRGADIVILVFDLTKLQSFSNLNSWKSEIKIQVGSDDCVVVAAGNKLDLVEGKERPIDPLLLEEFCQEKDLQYFETSARNATNLDDLFEYVIHKCIGRHKNIKGAIRK